MVKKALYPFMALIFVVSGCMYQKPDYLKVITATDLSRLMQHEDVFPMPLS